MPLAYALFLSLLAHAAAILFAHTLHFDVSAASSPHGRVEARLRRLPEPPIDSLRHSVSTIEEKARSAEPPPPTPSKAASLSKVRRQAMLELTRHLYYPTEAVLNGLEGEAILLLRIDARGGVYEAKLARSSGHALLDDAALDAGRRMAGLPPGPREMLLPVEFRLN